MADERLVNTLRRFGDVPSPPSRISGGEPPLPRPPVVRDFQYYLGPHAGQAVSNLYTLGKLGVDYLTPIGALKDANAAAGEAALAFREGSTVSGIKNLLSSAGSVALGFLPPVVKKLVRGLPKRGAMDTAAEEQLRLARLLQNPVLDAEYNVGLGQIDEQLARVRGGEKALPATQTTGRFSDTNMTQEEALAAARRGDHINVGPKNTIAGAPKAFTGAADIANTRRASDDLVALGAGQREWYEDAVKAIDAYSPTANIANALGGGMAWMSPNSSPEGATQNTVAMMANLAGGNRPKMYGLTQHARRFLDQYPDANREGTGVATAPGQPYLPALPGGPKTGPFANYLLGLTDWRTVNDLWRARAQGYSDKEAGSLDKAHHNYMWGEGVLSAQRANLLRIGGRTDWTPAQIQAAEWVGRRVMSLIQERDERIAGVKANKNLSAVEKQRAIAKEMTNEQLLASANAPVRQTLDNRVYTMMSGGVPSASSGHFPGLANASEADLAAFASKHLRPYTTTGKEGRGIKAGYSAPYTAVGLAHEGTFPDIARTALPGTDIKPGATFTTTGPVLPVDKGDPRLFPRSKTLLNQIEGVNNAMQGVDSTFGIRFLPMSEKGATESKLGSVSYQGNNVDGAIEAMKRHGLNPIYIGRNQVVAGNLDGALKAPQIRAARAALLEEGFPTTPGQVHGGLYGEVPNKGPGSVTAAMVSNFSGDAGRRVAESLDIAIRPIAKQLYEASASIKNMGSPSAKIQELRRVLRDEGLVSLMEATKGMSRSKMEKYFASRGLPGIAVALLGAGLYGNEQPDATD
jgi:hypothetical protein